MNGKNWKRFVYEDCQPGQGVVLHSWNSWAGPRHVIPPYLGLGLEQVRLRFRTPELQSRLHWLQGPQAAQPPFTVNPVIRPERSKSPTTRTDTHKTEPVSMKLLGHMNRSRVFDFIYYFEKIIHTTWTISKEQNGLSNQLPVPFTTITADYYWLHLCPKTFILSNRVFLPLSICLHRDLCVCTADLERDPSVTVPVSHSHLSIPSRRLRYMGRPIISPEPQHTALSKVIDYFIIYSHLKAGRPALMANGKGTQVSVQARPTGKQTVLRSMSFTMKRLTTLIFTKV